MTQVVELKMSGAPAPVIAALEALYDNGLEPSAVVAAAEDSASPLHDQFEWDDGVAGHEYRLFQARQLIARVKVTIVSEPTAKPVRAFVNIKTETARAYVHTAEVMSSSVLMEQVRNSVGRELERVAEKLAMFEEFAAALVAVQAAQAALAAAPVAKKRRRKAAA